MSKPILKVVEGLFQPKQAPRGWARRFSVASVAADLLPHDAEGLLQILHFRNQVAKAAGRRSHWIGGRIYNKFSGEDPDYIPMSGTHLRQAFSVVNIDTPDFIVPSGKYLLRLDVSQDAVKILLEQRSS